MKVKIAGICILAAVLALSACSSAAQAPGTSSSGSASRLTFNADGTPNLKGMTLSIGNAAGSAHTGDTRL